MIVIGVVSMTLEKGKKVEKGKRMTTILESMVELVSSFLWRELLWTIDRQTERGVNTEARARSESLFCCFDCSRVLDSKGLMSVDMEASSLLLI